MWLAIILTIVVVAVLIFLIFMFISWCSNKGTKEDCKKDKEDCKKDCKKEKPCDDEDSETESCTKDGKCCRKKKEHCGRDGRDGRDGRHGCDGKDGKMCQTALFNAVNKFLNESGFWNEGQTNTVSGCFQKALPLVNTKIQDSGDFVLANGNRQIIATKDGVYNFGYRIQLQAQYGNDASTNIVLYWRRTRGVDMKVICNSERFFTIPNPGFVYEGDYDVALVKGDVLELFASVELLSPDGLTVNVNSWFTNSEETSASLYLNYLGPYQELAQCDLTHYIEACPF